MRRRLVGSSRFSSSGGVVLGQPPLHKTRRYTASNSTEIETNIPTAPTEFPITLAVRIRFSSTASGNMLPMALNLGSGYYLSFARRGSNIFWIDANGIGTAATSTGVTVDNSIWWDLLVHYKPDGTPTDCSSFDFYYKRSNSKGWSSVSKSQSTVTIGSGMVNHMTGTYRDSAPGLYFDGQINKSAIWYTAPSGLGDEFPNKDSFSGAKSFHDFDVQLDDLIPGTTTTDGGDTGNPTSAASFRAKWY